MPLALPAATASFCQFLAPAEAAKGKTSAAVTRLAPQLYSFNALGILGSGIHAASSPGTRSLSGGHTVGRAATGQGAVGALSMVTMNESDDRAENLATLPSPEIIDHFEARDLETGNEMVLMTRRAEATANIRLGVVTPSLSQSGMPLAASNTLKFGGMEEAQTSVSPSGKPLRLPRTVAIRPADPVRVIISEVEGRLQILGAAPDIPEADRLKIRVIAESLANEVGTHLGELTLNGTPVQSQKTSGRSAS